MNKVDLIHRITAIFLAAILITLAFLNGGLELGLRVVLFCIFPVFCISFPEEVDWHFVSSGEGSPSHPTVLRYAAWGLLIVPPIMIALTPILSKPARMKNKPSVSQEKIGIIASEIPLK
jgi:hypothetical protein